jgi:hypothetical protein
LKSSSDGDEDYNFYDQSVNIFVTGGKDTSSRKITTSLMFNKNTNGSPHIHIREAARQKGKYNSIGALGLDYHENNDGSFTANYRDTKTAGYEVLITASNPLDSILVGEVTYSLLWGAYETLVVNFDEFDLSMKDIMFKDELNTSLYAKAISISTQQENIIPSIIDEQLINQINFVLTSVNGTDIIE